MKIEIALKIIRGPDVGPNIRIWLNNKEYGNFSNIQENTVIDIADIENFKDINLLWIEHHGKDPTATHGHEVAAEIESIKFGGMLLPRNLMYAQTFFPNWQYGPAENFILQNCYLGFNGIWQLTFPKNPKEWIADFLEEEMFHHDGLTRPDDNDDLMDFRNFFD